MSENKSFRLFAADEKAHSEGEFGFASKYKKKEKGMQISISGHQLDVTNALKSYVTEKLDRIEQQLSKLST